MGEKMEAVINLNEILSWLKKRILLIICTLIGGFAVATGITYFVITPTYSSSAELIVQSKNEIVNHNLQSEVHANVLLINTYKDMILGDIVLNEATEYLENKFAYYLTKDQLRKNIQIIQSSDSQMFHIKVMSDEAEKAANIANVLAYTFEEKVKEVLDVNKVTITSIAQANQLPVSPNKRLNLFLGAFLGLLLGIGMAVLLEILDKTVKDEHFLATMGYPVLGIISEMSNKEIESGQSIQLTTYSRQGTHTHRQRARTHLSRENRFTRK